MLYPPPKPRPEHVAALAGVSPSELVSLTETEVREALRGRIDPTIVVVATGEDQYLPANYWRAGEGATARYFLDDASFGPVVEFTHLAYRVDLGLYDTRQFPDKESETSA